MSESHYFYNVLRKSIIQFTDIFNDLVVARYDDSGNITKYVKVPVKFAPKTKQWYWSELRDNKDRRDNIFPMISVDLDSVEYASDRQVNRNIRIPAINDGVHIQSYYNPVPYDFMFNVQIASQYIIDEVQLIEQILPFFTPENWIRISIPELDITGIDNNNKDHTEKLLLRVVYDGSSNDRPVELEEAGYRILLWTHTFKVQGYLFTPIMSDGGAIHRVIQSYYTNPYTWAKRLEDNENEYFETGNASVQGITYSPVVYEPDITNGERIDDTIRSMWKYEHYPRECRVNLYSVPPTGSYEYPISVELKSDTPIRDIWYTIVETNGIFIVDDNDQFIVVDGNYVILSSNDITYEMTRYWRPIELPDGLNTYTIMYVGVGEDGSTTPIFTSQFSPLAPV